MTDKKINDVSDFYTEEQADAWTAGYKAALVELVFLTDDETMFLANETSGSYWGTEKHLQAFRKAIEEKIKEKNNV